MYSILGDGGDAETITLVGNITFSSGALVTANTLGDTT